MTAGALPDACWRRLFARHQYFDSSGMFISMLLSLPIMFNCCIAVVHLPAAHTLIDPRQILMLREAGALAVKLGRAKQAHKIKQRQQREAKKDQ